MENKASWHHGVPTAEQHAMAVEEINNRIKDLEKTLK